MNLSTDQEREILEMVARNLADRIWKKIEGGIDEVVCLSIPRASGALELSTQQANKVLTEFVDFGPRDKRVTLAALKRAIEHRTVKPKGGARR
jgi:hypothetical protein